MAPDAPDEGRLGLISAVALGVALGEADHKVREEGGNNRGARIRTYLDNAGIAIPAPWCAAFVQYCADVAARGLGTPNPLDEVQLEALVESYVDRLEGSTVGREDVRAGDLVAFQFGEADRWNHIGYVAQPPRPGAKGFWTVEGNTGDLSQRDGGGVHLKPRELDAYPVRFFAWDGRVIE